MKIIEKKCPNCGAGLNFDENDKSCKCEYCKKEFEIERDQQNNSNNLPDQFKLSEAGKSFMKIAGITMLVPSIFFIIIFLIIVTTLVIVIPKSINQTIKPKQIIENINKIDSENLYTIKETANNIDYQTAKGQNDLKYSFIESDSLKIEKMYFSYKNDSNYIIFIYKTKYHNYWDQTNEQTVYIPVIFKNIKNNLSNIKNGKNPAPEYYFNSEKTTYIYAYASFEDAYNNVVKPLEKDYNFKEINE